MKIDEHLKEANRQLKIYMRLYQEGLKKIDKLNVAINTTINIYNTSQSSSPFGDAIEILEDALNETK